MYIFNGSQVIAEYDNGAAVTAPTREYIYLGGRKLAVYFGSTITYYHADHLSNRRMSNSSGSGTTQLGNFPFGEAWYGTGAKWRFTSYERDTETGNDYAITRTYINRCGRFGSPDVLGGDIGDPQSLNRYSYVVSDPVNQVDPLGLQGCTLHVSSNAPLSNQTKLAVEAIFRNAGVGISWSTGTQHADLNVQLGVALVVPGRWELFSEALGHNPPGSSVAEVDTARIYAVARQLTGGGLSIVGSDPSALGMTSTAVNNAIGVTIAHEFGHYLLSSGGHTTRGLMRPDLGTNQFLVFGGSGQQFTGPQAKAIRRRCQDLHQNGIGLGSGSGFGGPASGATSFYVGWTRGLIGRYFYDGWHDVYGLVPLLNPFSIFGDMSIYQPPPTSPARPL